MSGNDERPKKKEFDAGSFDETILSYMTESIRTGILFNYQDFSRIDLNNGESLQIQFEFVIGQEEEDVRE